MIHRVGDDRVQVVADLRIELRIERGRLRRAAAPTACLPIPWPRDFAVAIRVEHLPAPANRLLFIVRLLVHLRVHPADDGTGQFVEIERFVGIGIELQVVRAVARVDQRELLRAGIVERHLAEALLQREPLRKLVLRVAAPGGVLVRTDLRRHPDAPLAVHHGVVRIGRVVWRVAPEMLVAPPERRTIRLGKARRDVGARRAGRNLHFECTVLFWIQHDQRAMAGGHRVDPTAGIDSWVVLRRGDLVVHERVIGTPVPQRHHQIAFDAFRPRRRRRHVAFGDAIGPVGQRTGGPRHAHIGERAVHRVAAHAGAETPFPRVRGRFQIRLRLEDMIEAPRQSIPELMTEIAVRLQAVHPVVLRQHRRAQSVAFTSSTGELTPRRRLEQGEPVVAGIHLRRFLWGLGQRRLQGHRVAARLHLHRLRVDQPVSPDPHAVARVRELGQHETSPIVGDDNLDEIRRQVPGFRDDPDARFRTVTALDDAGDVVGNVARLKGRDGGKGSRSSQRDNETCKRRAAHCAPGIP